MTNDLRSPEQIEREIEAERAGLSSTLDELQDRFSVDQIARQFTEQLRVHGADFGRSVTETVKRNPMALGLTAVGIAWMVFGNNSRSSASAESGSTAYRGGRRGMSSYPLTDRHSEARRIAGRAGEAADHSNDPFWASRLDSDEWGEDFYDDEFDADYEGSSRSIKDRAHDAADSAGSAARRAGRSVSGSASSAMDTLKDAGRNARRSVRNAASTTSRRATELSRRLSAGTEAMSEEARERVLAARRSAVEARDAAWEMSRRSRERAADIYDEQPLVIGALAVAAGAALGAGLPRSKTEDHYMGAHSDRLFEEAERIYEEERRKLTEVAKAATTEARNVASDAKAKAESEASGLVDKAVETAESSAKRVANAASSEAEKQKLGDIKA
ncbi:DUF3618 domain-containing protein [Sulfitobacter sp. LCG007]